MSKSTLELTPVEAVACCSPVTREALSSEAANRIAPLVKALADPVRLRLVSLVASHADGEACVCDLNDALRPVPADDQLPPQAAARGRDPGP